MYYRSELNGPMAATCGRVVASRSGLKAAATTRHRALGGIADLPACAVANQSASLLRAPASKRPAKGDWHSPEPARRVGCRTGGRQPARISPSNPKIDWIMILGARSGLVGADDHLSVSTAGRRRMTARRPAIRAMPMAGDGHGGERASAGNCRPPARSQR